jgi:hypothetical protein
MPVFMWGSTSAYLLLRVLGRRTGEEALAFLPRRPTFDELQEHPPRGAAPRAVFGQHAATRFTGKRVREDGGELLYRECVHRGSSHGRTQQGRAAQPRRPQGAVSASQSPRCIRGAR